VNGGLDFATGVATLWLAAVLSVIHVLTSPKREYWAHLPGYIRLPLPIASCLFLFRGVELIGAGLHQQSVSGHATALGFLSTFSLNTVAFGCLCFIIARTYPPEVWARIREFRKAVETGQPTPAELEEVDALMAAPTLPNLWINGVYIFHPREGAAR
jgi:hypothetical protein